MLLDVLLLAAPPSLPPTTATAVVEVMDTNCCYQNRQVQIAGSLPSESLHDWEQRQIVQNIRDPIEFWSHYETPIIFGDDRGVSSHFNNVVVAGNWQQVYRALYRSDIAIDSLFEIPRQFRIPIISPRPEQGIPALATCTVIQGQGALRGAVAVCVANGREGSALDERIYNSEYIGRVQDEIFNFSGSPY